MYLLEIHIVDDDYKSRSDDYWTEIYDTIEEVIRDINDQIYFYVMFDENEDEVKNSKVIRNDLIEKHLKTEFVDEALKILYSVYDITDTKNRKLVYTNKEE